MQTVFLQPHPDTPSSAIDRIEVEIDYEGRGWALVTFRMQGAIDRIVIPETPRAVEAAARDRQALFAAAAISKAMGRDVDVSVPGASDVGRVDGLWRTTCFEVFAKLSDGSYAEFNVSPSGEWAAYHFDGYRENMVRLDGSVQVTEVEHASNGLEIRALMSWSNWSLVKHLGLSAVIEDIDGAISYWALAHPSAKPDFHHPDSFVLELP